MTLRLVYPLVLVGCLATHTPAPAETPAKPAHPAAKDFDLQGFIDAELKAGNKRVVVPPGRYRVTPKQSRHLFFKGLADVEVVAEGVELVCTQTVQAVVFEDCRGVRLQGLTVDFDPLPFTEGRISAVAPDKAWVEFEVIEGYPENTLEERVEIYDPATGELRGETAGWAKQFEKVGPHRYRVGKRAGYRYDPKADTEQVGDILVTNNLSSEGGRGGHAISASGCQGLTLEGVTLYASNCFGFIEHRCNGSTYLRCKVDRRKPADDPVRRGFPRMRSLNADAFHSVEAEKGPALVGCTAKFQGDDCVNIHGTYHLVTAVSGKRLRVAALGRLTIEPGDPVEFLPFTGTRPADAVAAAVAPAGPITDAEKAFVRTLRMNEHNRERLLGGKATFHELTLDREVPLPAGSAVCSGKRVGNGFVVRGCDFGYNRSRGVLIKASRGQVVGNTISNTWMAAVLVSPEFWWFEAASSSDVEVRGNTIVGCRAPAIEVVAPGGDGRPLASGAHRSIAIVKNTIVRSAWPNVRVTSTDGLTITDNVLTPAEPEAFVPPLARRWNWGKSRPAAVVTELCDH